MMTVKRRTTTMMIAMIATTVMTRMPSCRESWRGFERKEKKRRNKRYAAWFYYYGGLLVKSRKNANVDLYRRRNAPRKIRMLVSAILHSVTRCSISRISQ